MKLGIVDVGTNSIHLLVGILGFDGAFHVILKERDLTRLGEGGLARGRLTGAAMERALRVLEQYGDAVRRFQVDHVEAVATSAAREAANGPAFIHRARARSGLPLRIISGREEARLIYLGALQTHRRPGTSLLITIGGGSVQVVLGDGSRLRYATSVQLGCARLSQQFIRHDPADPDEITAMRKDVERRLAPITASVKRLGRDHALACSATTYQLMLAAHLQRHRRPPEERRQLWITRRALAELVEWLGRSTAEERIELNGLDPRREDLALATGIVLLTWMKQCRIARLGCVDGSLREGLVIDYLLRHEAGLTRRPHVLASLLNGARDRNGALGEPIRIVRRLRMPRKQRSRA